MPMDYMESTEEVVVKKVKKKNYINNRDFHDALVVWLTERKTNPKARMSDYIGRCFQKIAEGRAKHPWYSGWTFKDDMISNAILICCQYAHNYKPEKSENPFAYFTQCCNNAFDQLKTKEKKLADFKFEMVKEGSKNSEDYDYKNFMNNEDY
jgi:hypothetical protein